MKYLQKLIDSFFISHPNFKSFCFRWLPFRSTFFEETAWTKYIAAHPNAETLLPVSLDSLSIKLVKRLLHRRTKNRFVFSLSETWQYYRTQNTRIPYWFPNNGTLIKSVFAYKAGLTFLPPNRMHLLIGRDIIDGGAASGDSSIVLSDCGASKVYAFEPSPNQQDEMASVFSRNNKTKLIDIIPLGLSEKSEIFTAQDQYGKSFTARTTSIDAFCAEKEIGCIKLDIEGAEFPALRGAAKTIERCKPILLICVYHKPEDLFEMPRWLMQNFPYYQIMLRDTEPANRGAGVHLVMIAAPKHTTTDKL